MTRRASVLLELMLSLAILIALSGAIYAVVARAASAVEDARLQERAADVARSAMARIESGLATPATMSGPSIERGREDWTIEARSEASEFPGASIVVVTASLPDPFEPGRTRASFTLAQLVLDRPGPAGGTP
jgi:type II secretory pathway pseudopilin PulG